MQLTFKAYNEVHRLQLPLFSCQPLLFSASVPYDNHGKVHRLVYMYICTQVRMLCMGVNFYLSCTVSISAIYFLTLTVEPNPYNLKVGSVVQYGNPVEYGEIKWMGHLPGEEGLYAGVEMVRHLVNVSV